MESSLKRPLSFLCRFLESWTETKTHSPEVGKDVPRILEDLLPLLCVSVSTTSKTLSEALLSPSTLVDKTTPKCPRALDWFLLP